MRVQIWSFFKYGSYFDQHPDPNPDSGTNIEYITDVIAYKIDEKNLSVRMLENRIRIKNE